ncbi:MAG TPA: hypothetical protein PL110_07695 [Candidatus Eremiobacteraeota bacterium]|nr:MAG: hypothetical protein BWY64_00810 [bacterium ADurb.Bin363]HPZ07980.1 hypothetical protein [Candidatus Eremiobacteraeota bacterium]
MSEKSLLQDILSKLSIKIEKINFDVQNISLNLNEKSTSIEGADFTMSNIYKGDSLITPKVNVNISSVNIPLDEIYPFIEEKLKGEKKVKSKE